MTKLINFLIKISFIALLFQMAIAQEAEIISYHNAQETGLYSDPIKMLATEDLGLIALFNDQITRFDQSTGVLEWIKPHGGNNFIVDIDGALWIISHTSGIDNTPILTKLDPNGEDVFSITDFAIAEGQLRRVLSLFEDEERIILFGYANTLLQSNTSIFQPAILVYDKDGALLTHRILPEIIDTNYAEWLINNNSSQSPSVSTTNNIDIAGMQDGSYYFITYEASATIDTVVTCLNTVDEYIYTHYINPTDLTTLSTTLIDEEHIDFFPDLFCLSDHYLEILAYYKYIPENFNSYSRFIRGEETSEKLTSLEMDNLYFSHLAMNLSPEIMPYVYTGGLYARNESVNDMWNIGNQKIAIANMYVWYYYPILFLPDTIPPIYDDFYASAYILTNADGQTYCSGKLGNYSYCKSITAANENGTLFILQKPIDLYSIMTLSKIELACENPINPITYHIPNWPPDTIAICGTDSLALEIEAPYFIRNDSILPLNPTQYEFYLTGENYYHSLSLTSTNTINIDLETLGETNADTFLLYPVLEDYYYEAYTNVFQTPPPFPPLVIIKPPLELDIQYALNCITDNTEFISCQNISDYFVESEIIMTISDPTLTSLSPRYSFNLYLDDMANHNLLPSPAIIENYDENGLIAVINLELPLLQDEAHQIIVEIRDHVCGTSYYHTLPIHCMLSDFAALSLPAVNTPIDYCQLLEVPINNFNHQALNECPELTTGYLLFQTNTLLQNGQALDTESLNLINPTNTNYYPTNYFGVPQLTISDEINTYYSPIIFTDVNADGWDLDDYQWLYSVVPILTPGESIGLEIMTNEFNQANSINSCDISSFIPSRNISFHSNNIENTEIMLTIHGQMTGQDTTLITMLSLDGHTDDIALSAYWLAETMLHIIVSTTEIDCMYGTSLTVELPIPDPATWAEPWYPLPIAIEEYDFCDGQSINASVPCYFDAEAFIHSIGDPLGITTMDDQFYNIEYHLETIGENNQWQSIAISHDGLFDSEQYNTSNDSIFQISILATDSQNNTYPPKMVHIAYQV